MAEGYDFDNPVFDEDDYDKEEETSFIDEQQFQRTLNIQYNTLDTLTGYDKNERISTLLNMLTKQFFERNQEPTRQGNYYFKPDDYGRPIFGVEIDEKDYPLSFYKSSIIQFYSFDTLQKKYGVNFIRINLGVDDFQTSATRVKQGRKEFQQLIETRDKINNATENIPLQDISSQQEGQELLNTINIVDVGLNELGTQTDMTKREMDGIISAMTSVKEEIANELVKLAETNKDIAKENTKLEQAKSDNDEFQIERISSRIRDLESERSARLEVINVNRDRLRSQVNRIKETINKVLKEDTTLAQRIKTLFREQGITIVSVLTAFGMIIGVIVETFIPTTGGGTTTPSKPPPKDGIGDWVKKQLSNLGKLLAKLAGKAAEALPGIIGAIVSWLLSTTGKIVSWFGEYLWALVVLVAGLLYTVAKEYNK